MNHSKYQQNQKQPDEALLLAYIEGSLSAEEAKTVEQNLIDQPALMAVLLEMREDRKLIQEIKLTTEIKTPTGIVNDVLAIMERTMLLDDAPDAPLISIKRNNPASWWRYAVAAAFLILLSVAVVMIFQGLFSPGNNPDLAELLANNTAENNSLELNSESTVADSNINLTDTNIPNSPNHKSTSQSGNNNLESAKIAYDTNTDNLSTKTEITEENNHKQPLTVSVGFTANIACADNNDALTLISNYLQSQGGGIIPNASDSINYNYSNIDENDNGNTIGNRNNNANTNFVRQSFETDNRYQNLTTPSNRIPDNNIYGSDWSSESINLVPLDDQISYRKDGYQYTLIGTPTAIREILTQLSKQPGYSFDWGRKPQDLSFDSLIIPPRPIGSQWIPVVMWWIDPHQYLPLSLDAAKAIQKEPVIRIPFRLVEKPYLKRQLDRSKKNDN